MSDHYDRYNGMEELLGTNLAEVGTDVPDNNVGELISRQAALDALYHVDEYNSRSVEAIRNLPSAEPQIIRCKDCKWNRTENRKETTQWLPCRAIVTPDNFSCIYAERRTEWE